MHIPNPCRYLKGVPEGERLKLLHLIVWPSLQEAQERTTRALSWRRNVERLQERGLIRVIVWQRDCDCSEGWHTYVIPVAQLQQRIDRDLQGAEGPMRHSLARPSETPNLPRSRDRALEAHENGHPWSV